MNALNFLERHSIGMMILLIALLVSLMIWTALDESQHAPYYNEEVRR